MAKMLLAAGIVRDIWFDRKSRRRSRGSNVGSVKTTHISFTNFVVGVLIAFLLIGFLGSLFSGAPTDPDLDATKPPVTDVTDPAPELITFSTIAHDDMQAEAGMTFAEWCDSDYCPYQPLEPGQESPSISYWIDSNGQFCVFSYGALVYSDNQEIVKGTDVIPDGANLHPC